MHKSEETHHRSGEEMRADATGRLTPAQHYLRSPTAMQRQNEVSPIVKNFIITAAYQSELNSHLFRMLHKRLPLRHRILSCLVGHPHPGPSPAILPLNQFLANASWEAADEGSSTGPLPQHGKLRQSVGSCLLLPLQTMSPYTT